MKNRAHSMAYFCIVGLSVQAAMAAPPNDTFAKLSKRVEALPQLYVIPPEVKEETAKINKELGRLSPTEWIEIAKNLPLQSAKTRAFILDNLATNKRAEAVPYLEKQYDSEPDVFGRDHICRVIACIDFDKNSSFFTHALKDSSPWVRAAVLGCLMGRQLKPNQLQNAVELLSNDPSAMVRGRAVFAVSESGATNARELLTKALQQEKDVEVCQNIRSALKEMR